MNPAGGSDLDDPRMREEAPRHARISTLELEQRLIAVAGMLAEGYTRGEVTVAARARWGVGSRSVDNYLTEVRKRWLLQSAGGFEEARATTIARLESLGRQRRSDRAWIAAVGLERLLAQVRGVVRSEDGRLSREEPAAALIIEVPAALGPAPPVVIDVEAEPAPFHVVADSR